MPNELKLEVISTVNMQHSYVPGFEALTCSDMTVLWSRRQFADKLTRWIKSLVRALAPVRHVIMTK
jgi:hypothetical protein